MTRSLYFITHPNVVISREVPVPQWPLSELGVLRMRRSLHQPWMAAVTSIYCSTEQKAIDGEAILSEHLSLGFTTVEALGENDRSSTGFLAPAEFERVADDFFGRPEVSIRGWERAVDAQSRIMSAVEGSGPYDADSWQTPLLAVGWLEHSHPIPRGSSPSGLVSQLQSLVFAAEEAHPHLNFRGLHSCSLCEAEGKVSEGLPNSHVNLFVPGNGAVFVAPAGITHYIESHSYAPPIEFIVAVSQCPAYGSSEFYEALRVANQHSPPPIRSWEAERLVNQAEQRKLLEARRGQDV